MNFDLPIPTHPGLILKEEFLIPFAITQTKLAKDLKMPHQRINEIINGKRGITPSTAIRLAKYFNTSIEFWLNLQSHYDLYYILEEEKKILSEIPTIENRETLTV
jgi:addiction module HigA family antidote